MNFRVEHNNLCKLYFLIIYDMDHILMFDGKKGSYFSDFFLYLDKERKQNYMFIKHMIMYFHMFYKIQDQVQWGRRKGTSCDSY